MQKRIYLTVHKNTSSSESVYTILTLKSKTVLPTAMQFKCTNYEPCRSEELKQREYGRAILIPQGIKRSTIFSPPLPVVLNLFYSVERA
jgi:hypothetical protein